MHIHEATETIQQWRFIRDRNLWAVLKLPRIATGRFTPSQSTNQMKTIATSVLIFCSWRQIIHPMRHGMSAQTKDSAGVRVPGFSPGAPPHQKKPLRKEKMPSVDTGCFRLLGSPATWTSRTVSPTSPRVALTIRPTSGHDQCKSLLCYSVCVAYQL